MTTDKPSDEAAAPRESVRWWRIAQTVEWTTARAADLRLEIAEDPKDPHRFRWRVLRWDSFRLAVTHRPGGGTVIERLLVDVSARVATTKHAACMPTRVFRARDLDEATQLGVALVNAWVRQPAPAGDPDPRRADPS